MVFIFERNTVTKQVRKLWTDEEVELINDPSLTIMDIVRLTGRSFASVRAKRRSPLNAAMTKAYRKKMKKKAAKTERVSPWTRWSDDEVEIAMNPNLTLEEKIQKIGRSYSAVVSKIGKLKEK